MSDEDTATMESPPPGTGERDEATVQEGAAGAGAAGGEVEAVPAELAAAQAERDAALAAVQQARAESEARIAALQEAHDRASAALLESHRRALLAENRGQIVEELVVGDTTEALTAAVEVARTAYARVVEAVRAQAAATVPAGASAQSVPDAESMSPLQKITGALRRTER
jgi:hypothetical protein